MDDVEDPELPPPPPPAPSPPTAPRSSRTKWVVLGVVAAVVLVGGFFVARGIYWSVLVSTPDFPSLEAEPDPSLTGTVAFLKPNDFDCIYLVAASGGAPEELACADRLGGDLRWLDDGRLQSTAYPAADTDDEPASWIIDPATGEVEELPADEVPEPSDLPQESPIGPNGEQVTCDTGEGTLTLTLTADGTSRTLLSTEAPSTYCIGGPAWNGDGSWFVAKDDLDRLLLVTTDDPSTTRVLVDGGYDAVVTDADLLGG